MADTKSVIYAMYQQIEDCDPMTEDLKDKMRRMICANAVGETHEEQVADAVELMMMLGVHPSQVEEEQ